MPSISYPFSFSWNDNLTDIYFGLPVTNPSNLYIPNYSTIGQTTISITPEFTAQLSGIYEIDLDVQIIADVKHAWSSIPDYTNTFTAELYLEVLGGQNVTLDYNSQSYTGIYSYTSNGQQYRAFSQTSTYNGTTTIFLNAGQKVRVKFRTDQTWQTNNTPYFGAINLTLSQTDYFTYHTADFTQPAKAHFKLKPQITFNQIVYPNAFLPNIKGSDYFKDVCFRYGILPVIDEYNKSVTLKSFSRLKDNIGDAYDWSDKLDETDYPDITFSLGNYARNNSVMYKEDESVPLKPFGADFIISINNENLDLNKKLYESCFASSIDKSAFTTENVIYIDMYDTTTLAFTKKVEPRVCYLKKRAKSVSYTDGTTTTALTTDIPFTWFIDGTNDFSMGFGTNLMNRHLSDIIAVLQNQKILKVNIKLNVSDLLNLDYYKPVYLNQFNAYFFISSINQFSFTSNESTEVILVKLN